MTPNILNKLRAQRAATNSKRLGSLAKANAEILNLAKSAGYSGNDPEAALVHLERRSVAAVSVNAPLAKVSVSSAQPDRKTALWAEYNALPVAKRNAFYKQHRSEMSSSAPAVIVRSGRVAK
jgi:hypothetical protein